MLTRVRSAGPDAGISLTELLVTMSLMSIAGALGLTMLVTTANTTDRTADGSLSTAGARNTMSAWTDLLQVAVVPSGDPADRALTVTPTSLSFNAQLGNLPTCSDSCTTTATTRVTLQLRGDQLVQTLTRGTGAPDTVVQVSEGASLPAAADGVPACLFRPYRADGTALDCSNLDATATTGVTRVDVAFRITPRSGPVRSYTSTAKLPGGAT